MVNIYMARKTADRRGWLNEDDAPLSIPIISAGKLILGMLMFHDSYRHPDDPVYRVETIGL